MVKHLLSSVTHNLLTYNSKHFTCICFLLCKRLLNQSLVFTSHELQKDNKFPCISIGNYIHNKIISILNLNIPHCDTLTLQCSHSKSLLVGWGMLVEFFQIGPAERCMLMSTACQVSEKEKPLHQLLNFVHQTLTYVCNKFDRSFNKC